MKTPLIFLYSHPIQYFVPLLQHLTKTTNGNIVAWYCSQKSLENYLDAEFGVKVKWDIPLLEGYDSRFLKNKPLSSNGFWSLFNLEIVKYIFLTKKSIFVVHGWNYATNILLILFGKLLGHKIALRAETPLKQELLKSAKKLFFRKFIFKYILFPFVDYFLYIGKQNEKFYQFYGVKKAKLVYTPYAVDNNRFQQEYDHLINKRDQLRKELGIPISSKVVLFSGKYIPKKRPMDLLKAALLLKEKKYFYIFMGEGILRKEMEEFVKSNNLSNIVFTGFINQSRVSEYYVVSDLFVMCSQEGETWGLSTNEAMNFRLPIVVSDLVGCSDDLVIEGKTGYSFGVGDIETLSTCISTIFDLPNSEYCTLRDACLVHINKHSFNEITNNLKLLIGQ
jgi:glycosyltransferase involved in cell wall biosynthesis